MVDGRLPLKVVGATRAMLPRVQKPRWRVLFLRAAGGQGALPDEMYKDRPRFHSAGPEAFAMVNGRMVEGHADGCG
jgi:hypothetical protein